MKWTRRDVVLGLPTLMAFNLIGCTAKTTAATNNETATTAETDKKASGATNSGWLCTHQHRRR